MNTNLKLKIGLLFTVILFRHDHRALVLCRGAGLVEEIPGTGRAETRS